MDYLVVLALIVLVLTYWWELFRNRRTQRFVDDLLRTNGQLIAASTSLCNGFIAYVDRTDPALARQLRREVEAADREARGG